MVYMRIDQIMIKEMLGEHAVGIYSAAVRLSEIWYFIPTLIMASLFPAIANAKKVSEELYYKRLQMLYTFMLWVAILIAAPMTFLSEWLVVLLYGDDYREAGQVLMILIWASIFVFLGVASGKWFLCENLQILSTANTTIGAIVNVTLNLILIPRYGIIGSAISTLVSYAVAAYFMNIIFHDTRENFIRLTCAVNILNLRK
jgi:O-antigen/teichoic acid export membrane protein